MALLLSQGPGVSADFIDAVKDCITMGGKYHGRSSVYRVLLLLR